MEQQSNKDVQQRFKLKDNKTWSGKASEKLAWVVRNKEVVNKMTYVSGQLCYIKAAYMSGLVAGNVNRINSCTQYKFEFKPLSMLNKKTLLLAEINRLYFDYKTCQGKKKIVLCYKSEEEYDKENIDYNLLDSELRFLAQIDGVRQPYISMFMQRRI